MLATVIQQCIQMWLVASLDSTFNRNQIKKYIFYILVRVFFLSGCFFNIQCSITSDSEVDGTLVNEEILNGNLQFQENSTKSFGWKKHSDTFTAKHNKKNTSWTGKFTQIYLYFMNIKHEISMCICCSFTTAWTAHFWRFYPVCQDHLRIYIYFLCSKDGFMQQKWLKFKPNLVCVYFTASQN